MGPLLGQLLGVQSAEHPLLDAAALQQSPPQLVVVVVGDKVCLCSSFCSPVHVRARQEVNIADPVAMSVCTLLPDLHKGSTFFWWLCYTFRRRPRPSAELILAAAWLPGAARVK